jgi:hypothetical protein
MLENCFEPDGKGGWPLISIYITIRDKMNGIIMNAMGRRKSSGSGKNNLAFGYDRLEVNRHEGYLNCLNGM